MNGWMDGWTHNRKGPSLHNSQKLTPDEYHRARLRAATAAHAGDWLLALPHSACGLRLDDEAIRIAACLRLGAWTCQLAYALVEGWSRRTFHTDCSVDSVQVDTQGTLT